MPCPGTVKNNSSKTSKALCCFNLSGPAPHVPWSNRATDLLCKLVALSSFLSAQALLGYAGFRCFHQPFWSVRRHTLQWVRVCLSSFAWAGGGGAALSYFQFAKQPPSFHQIFFNSFSNKQYSSKKVFKACGTFSPKLFRILHMMFSPFA